MPKSHQITTDIIYVTGCGRSGTSLVAGLFRNNNRYFGKDLYPSRDSNPRGFFESSEINLINEKIIMPYLPKCFMHGSLYFGLDSPRPGHTWLSRLGPEVSISADEEILEELKTVLSRKPVCLKDPRFCYTISEWIKQTNDSYGVICVFREPARTIQSIIKEVMRMDYLADFAISRYQLFELWELLYSRLLDMHKSPNWLFVSYESVLQGRAIRAIEEFVGEKVDASFPDKNLNRSSPELEVPESTLALYNRLLRLERNLG